MQPHTAVEALYGLQRRSGLEHGSEQCIGATISGIFPPRQMFGDFSFGRIQSEASPAREHARLSLFLAAGSPPHTMYDLGRTKILRITNRERHLDSPLAADHGMKKPPRKRAATCAHEVILASHRANIDKYSTAALRGALSCYYETLGSKEKRKNHSNLQ